MIVDKQGCLSRKFQNKYYRNWFFIKARTNNKNGLAGYIMFSGGKNKQVILNFPKEMIGKKVRFKMEKVVE